MAEIMRNDATRLNRRRLPTYTRRETAMKKIMTLMLGLSLVLGSVAFADDAKKEDGKTTKKGGKKGGKKEEKKDEKK
jgi:hypothetical protein